MKQQLQQKLSQVDLESEGVTVAMQMDGDSIKDALIATAVQQRVEHIWKNYDSNLDGALSEKEAAKLFSENFEYLFPDVQKSGDKYFTLKDLQEFSILWAENHSAQVSRQEVKEELESEQENILERKQQIQEAPDIKTVQNLLELSSKTPETMTTAQSKKSVLSQAEQDKVLGRTPKLVQGKLKEELKNTEQDSDDK